MNKHKLRGALISRGMTYDNVAKELGMSISAFTNKINGHTEFTLAEVLNIKKLLSLTDIEFESIFLCPEEVAE